jgi:hypothetical protein
MAVGACIRQNSIHMIWNDVFFRNCVGVVVARIPFWMDELNDDE